MCRVWSEVFCVRRENLGQWEKIARGEVEDVVPCRPSDSGPVKVDNWLPKGSLAHQRKTTWILPRTWNSVGGRTRILCYSSRRFRWRWLDFEKEKENKQHTVTSLGDGGVNTGGFTNPRDWQSWWGWGTSTHHPASTQLGNSFGRMDLWWFGFFLVVILLWLFFFGGGELSRWFFYGLVFAEALLWTFHRLGYVKSCCRFRLFFSFF